MVVSYQLSVVSCQLQEGVFVWVFPMLNENLLIDN